MFDFLKKLFGTKSEKDIKNLQSKVDEINTIFSALQSVSNDELRAKTTALKSAIKDAVKEQAEKIDAIKTRVNNEPDIDVYTKEDLYKEIDDIELEMTAGLEKALTDNL